MDEFYPCASYICQISLISSKKLMKNNEKLVFYQEDHFFSYLECMFVRNDFFI